jgi:uncharacterized protein (DUF1330 family)
VSVYVISEVEILDETRAARYRELAAASIAHHSGRYLARGATPDVLEGAFDAKRRVIVVEFPDRATAVRWYDSPEYREARSISETALDRRLLLVDGVA